MCTFIFRKIINENKIEKEWKEELNRKRADINRLKDYIAENVMYKVQAFLSENMCGYCVYKFMYATKQLNYPTLLRFFFFLFFRSLLNTYYYIFYYFHFA